MKEIFACAIIVLELILSRDALTILVEVLRASSSSLASLQMSSRHRAHNIWKILIIYDFLINVFFLGPLWASTIAILLSNIWRGRFFSAASFRQTSLILSIVVTLKISKQ